MAAFTSTQAGNWSSPATWGGTGPPGAGDTATVNHAVAITANTTIGDGTATTVLSLATTASSLAITGATLTIKGNATIGAYNGAGVLAYITLTPSGSTGAGILLYGNASVTPTITLSYDCMIKSIGTSAGRNFIRSADAGKGDPITNAGNNGVFSSNISGYGSGWCDFQYTDFYKLGGASAAGYSANPNQATSIPAPYSATNPPLRFINCTIDHCGQLPFAAVGQTANPGMDLEVTGSTWSNPLDSSAYLLSLQANTNTAIGTGTRNIRGNTFLGGPPNFPAPRDFTITGNYFDDNMVCGGGSNLLWASCTGNFVRTSRGATEHQWGGGAVGNYCLFNPTLSDATGTHFLLIPQATDSTYTGNIFQAANTSSADRSCIGETEADTGVRTCTARFNLMLGGFGRLMATNSQNTGRTNVNGEHNTVCEHNTGIVDGTVGLVECGVQDAQTIQSLRSNIAYRASASTGIYLFNNNDPAPVNDVIKNTSGGLPSYGDYNGWWNLNTASTGSQSGTPYNTGLTVVPGGHDQHADPQFVDATRDLFTWAQSQHAIGDGTSSPANVASVLSYVQANMGLVSTDLIPWVFAGFRPRNASYRGATYPGDAATTDATGNPLNGTIGAVGMPSSVGHSLTTLGCGA